jgi:hypothetical protein
MDTDSLSSLIDRLEEETETLASAAERSRRLVLLSRVAVAAGLLWLTLGLIGIAPLEATDLVFAIAAVIGGVVFAGSSQSTLQETEAAIRKAQATRSQLIDRLDPAPVSPVRETGRTGEGGGAEIIELFPRAKDLPPARRTVH